MSLTNKCLLSAHFFPCDMYILNAQRKKQRSIPWVHKTYFEEKIILEALHRTVSVILKVQVNFLNSCVLLISWVIWGNIITT
jgi:hypothetical protein